MIQSVMALLLLFAALVLFYFKFNRYGNGVFLNYHLYQLCMAGLYLGSTLILRNVGLAFYNIESLGFVNLPEYNNEVDFYSVYFIFVFFIFYCFDGRSGNVLRINHSFQKLNSYKPVFFIRLIVVVIFLFGLILLVYYYKNFPVGSGREHLFSYSSAFASYFKVGYVFYFGLVFSFYLAITTGRLRYFLFLIPLVLIELSSGGRIYLVQYFIFIFIAKILLAKKPVSLMYPVGTIILILLIGLIRGYNSDFGSTFGVVVYIFGEFVNTSDSVFLALDSGYVYDYSEYIAYSLSRVIPTVISSYLFLSEFVLLVDVINELKISHLGDGFNVGLGGSILADAIFISGGNTGVIILYPIFMGMFGVVVNFLVRNGGGISLFFFMFSISKLFLIFRYGFYTTFLSGVSNIIFFCGWLWLLSMLNRGAEDGRK